MLVFMESGVYKILKSVWIYGFDFFIRITFHCPMKVFCPAIQNIPAKTVCFNIVF